MKFFLLISSLFAFFVPLEAQDLNGIKMLSDFTPANQASVFHNHEGEEVVASVDLERIHEVFGYPSYCNQYLCDEDDSSSITFEAEFSGTNGQKDVIVFTDGLLSYYKLKTPAFVAATNLFDGGIRVGDNISKVTSHAINGKNINQNTGFNSSLPVFHDNRNTNNNNSYSTDMWIDSVDSDFSICLKISGDVIVSIEYDAH